MLAWNRVPKPHSYRVLAQRLYHRRREFVAVAKVHAWSKPDLGVGGVALLPVERGMDSICEYLEFCRHSSRGIHSNEDVGGIRKSRI